MATQKRPIEQVVLRELAPIGKYKLRLIRGLQETSETHLDIREYAKGANFEGFTRRGIKIRFPEDAKQLYLALAEFFKSKRGAK